jgi:hypothetical protein
MRTELVASVMLVIASASGSWAAGASLECGRNLVVRFPKVALNDGERVVGVQLTVVGGSVVGVERIPRDWSVSVEPEVSGVASVTGSPQHGAGALRSTDGIPSVVVRGHTCDAAPVFALSADVHITPDFVTTRRINLDQRMLRIERAPNSTLQLPGAPPADAKDVGSRGAPAADRER